MIKEITSTIVALPPLLQLLIGIFATIGAIRLFMFVVDLIEDWKEGKHKD
jgi:hypothetical protein